MSVRKEKGEVGELHQARCATLLTKHHSDSCSEVHRARPLTHLRQVVDSRGAAGDAGQANGPRYEVDCEAAEALHAALFTFMTDGVGQQLLSEE